MSVTTAQAISLLENVLFETTAQATANAAGWVSLSNLSSSYSTVAGLASAMAQTPEASIVEQVIRYYEGALGRAPSGAEVAYYTNIVENGNAATGIAAMTSSEISSGSVSTATWNQIAAFFSASPEFAFASAGSNTVTLLYLNILGRTPSSAEVSYYENLLNTGYSVSTLVQFFTGSPEYQAKVNTQIQANIAAYGTTIANGGTAPSTVGDLQVSSQPGQAYTLTAAGDTFSAVTGSNGNTFNGTASTFSALDALTGSGTGNVLNITDTATGATGIDTTLAVGATVSGIQIANLVSTSTVTADTSAWTGLTTLNTADAGQLSVIAAGTTNVTSTVSGLTTNTVTIDGGQNVALTVSGATSTSTPATNNITIGGTTAPTGTVSVSETVAVSNSDNAYGISVTGGTVVTVTEHYSISALSGGNSITGGAVTINGGSATTAVTVNQTPAATTGGSSTSVGIVDGVVTIKDKNSIASTASAGTIASVTLNGFGGTSSTIDSNALTTLTLSNSDANASTTLTIDEGSYASPVTALTLNVDGNGALTITDTNNSYKTLNVVTGADASGTLTFAGTSVTAETISGSSVLSQAGSSMSALKTITVTGSAGLSDSSLASNAKLTSIDASAASGKITVTIDPTVTAFTGGTGVDVVTIGKVATKAIAAGTGTGNEIVWDGAALPTASSTATLGTVSGFTTMGVGADYANTTTTNFFDMSVISGYTALDVKGTSTASEFVGFDNVAAGTTLSLSGGVSGAGSQVVYALADTNGFTDSATVSIGATSSTSGVTVVHLTVEDSVNDGVGTLTINALNKSDTVTPTHSITTLTDSYLTSLTVGGTSSLTIGTLTDTAGTLTVAANAATNATGSTPGSTTLTFSTFTDNSLVNLAVNGTEAVSFGAFHNSATGSLSISVNDSAGVTVTDFYNGATIDTLAVTSLTITNSNTGTHGGFTLSDHVTDTSLTTLKLNGAVAGTFISGVNSAALTVSGSTDGSAVTIDVSSSAQLNKITLGGGADTVNLGTDTAATTGGNTVTFGAHTGVDTVTFADVVGTLNGINTATATQPSILTSGMNVITGLAAGDKLSFATTVAQVGHELTNATAITQETNLGGAGTGTIAEAHGTYSAGTFTYNANGADTLITWDTAITASTHYESVVLVGYNGTLATLNGSSVSVLG